MRRLVFSLKNIGMIAIVLVTAAKSFAQPAVENPSIQKALYLLETEQPKKALQELEQAISINATDASLLYYLGYVQLKADNKAAAVEAFEKGIKLNEKEALNYIGKGHINLLDGKPADAKLNIDKGLSLGGKKNLPVLKAAAEAYLVDNKYLIEAINLLNKAKSINDNDAEVHTLLGDAYLLQNTNAGQAVSSYERAASLKPSARTLHRTGKVFDRARNNENALENYNKAIALDPNFAPTYKELGELYYKTKEFQKAVTAYEKYLSLTEKPEAVQFQYAFYLFAAKDFVKANQVFKKIADAPDVKPVTLRFYAKSLSESGDFAQSVAVYEKYFAKAKPEEIEANDYEFYGKVLLRLKRDSLAIKSFRKSLALNSEQSELLQLIADTYRDFKKYPEAIAAYKELMAKRKPIKNTDYYNIGQAYYYNNQYPQADTAFTTLISRLLEAKSEVPSRVYLLEARIKSNFDEDQAQGLAKPYFEKLIEIGLSNPEKNKNDLVEAYGYLASYNYNVKHDIAATKPFYEKILQLKPDDDATKKNLEILNKMEQKK